MEKTCNSRAPREYTCIDCGISFCTAGSRAKRCPACAAAAKKAAAQAALQLDRDSADARKAADSSYSRVCYLYQHGYSRREIMHELNLSNYKVRKILVDAGLISYPETELFLAGCTVEEIAAQTGKSVSVVSAMIPYASVPYNSDHPSRSAANTRKFRERQKKKGERR